MVITAMPSSIGRRRIEELERFLRERNIEYDLEFAQKHYQTTGNITYSIPVV